MFSAIYVEREVRDHPRTLAILDRYRELPLIECERYGEIFNRKAQNFRMQKDSQALILAHKHGRKVLPAPGGHGFGASPSHYFSHMLNCIYDCRYCFLQGMYRSAHCVLFVNFEDFADMIAQAISAGPPGQMFHSGYDCDSLALEPASGFARFFVPFFAQHPQAMLELRTKSTQIASLLQMKPVPNCIVAMSFTTEAAAQRWERDLPSVSKRIAALGRLQDAGWPIALRFEPLLPETEPQEYAELFERIFARLDAARVHSASTGVFRMPAGYFRKVLRLYPDEPLLARETRNENGIVSFRQRDEEAWLGELESSLFRHIDPASHYRCTN